MDEANIASHCQSDEHTSRPRCELPLSQPPPQASSSLPSALCSAQCPYFSYLPLPFPASQLGSPRARPASPLRPPCAEHQSPPWSCSARNFLSIRSDRQRWCAIFPDRRRGRAAHLSRSTPWDSSLLSCLKRASCWLPMPIPSISRPLPSRRMAISSSLSCATALSSSLRSPIL